MGYRFTATGGNYNFTQIDNEIFDVHGKAIGLEGIGLYNLLARFAQGSGECWPSQDTLAKLAGTSRQRVNRLLKELEGVGLIKQVHRYNEHGQTSNGYILLPVQKRPQATPEGVTPVQSVQTVEWQQRWQEVVATGGEIRMTPRTMPARPQRVPYYLRRGFARWEAEQAIADIRQRNLDYLASLLTDGEPDGLAAD